MNVSDDLDRFRSLLRTDGVLHAELCGVEELEDFISRAIAAAQVRGLEIGPADRLRRALQPDPLGLSRFQAAVPSDDPPQPGWLPVQMLIQDGVYCIDWTYFGPRALREPFFEDSIRIALRYPISRLVRHVTRLTDLDRHVGNRAALAPQGFIFHMSRCGSTLAAQMLASDPRNIVISEASPLDSIVQLATVLPPQEGAATLQAIVRALGHRRNDTQERYFVKLDSWHILSLPLLRRAFPDVPWVFLYREPVEVLASQLVQRGIQMVPDYLPAALFGLTAEDVANSEAYCAAVLARVCTAARDGMALGGGRLINYRDMPQAVWTQILPHFGIVPSAEARAWMAEAAQFDAKSPSAHFVGDSQTKRQRMTQELRALSDRLMGEAYAELEALRMSDAAR